MHLHVFSIPMTTRFRGITVREGVLWEGSEGWAEFSPFNDYDPTESATWWRAAVEMAHEPWPTFRRDSIPVNCTVPAVAPEHAARIVRESNGCRTAKVKVAERGQSLADDLNRVAAVRDELGAGGSIRVDANGAWTQADAIDAITQLNTVAGGLEYVEQPCATIAELATVRRKTSVRIAADESIRRAEDPFEVARAEAADVAVVKVQPLGGVQAGLRIAEQIGLPIVVSSAVETSIGLSAGAALAAALPELPFACGLGTASLLTADVVANPLVPISGAISVGRLVVDSDRLAAVSADDATKKRWLQRVEAVKAVAV